jgi:hypothetical protein
VGEAIYALKRFLECNGLAGRIDNGTGAAQESAPTLEQLIDHVHNPLILPKRNENMRLRPPT